MATPNSVSLNISYISQRVFDSFSGSIFGRYDRTTNQPTMRIYFTERGGEALNRLLIYQIQFSDDQGDALYVVSVKNLGDQSN